MDTNSKLISEVDSGLYLANIPRSLLKVPHFSFIESLFQNLLPRKEDLTLYFSVNPKILCFETLHFPKLVKIPFLQKNVIYKFPTIEYLIDMCIFIM